MKKKNVFAIALSLALVAVLAVGATLAYFTSQDATQNVFTLGNVAIDLKESNDADAPDEAYVDTGLTYENVMPMDETTKIAKVFVDDASQDCYVQVVVDLTTPEGDAKMVATDLITMTDTVAAAVDAANWTVIRTGATQFTCTFKTAASAGDVLEVFSGFTMPNFGNSAAGKSFSIELTAYAVQAANVDLDTLDWGTLSFD